jgi:hypothetical protein
VNRDPYPKCALHNVNLVDSFPSGCIFAVGNPLKALDAIQDRGYRRAADESQEACSDWQRFDTCNQCDKQMWRHPRVRFLRRAAGIEVDK